MPKMNGFHLLQKRKSARESKTIFKLNLATKPLQCELVVTVTQVGAGKWPPTGLERELRQRTGRLPTLASRSPHSDAALMWPFSFICVTSHFLFLQLFCVIFPSLTISSVNAMPPKTRLNLGQRFDLIKQLDEKVNSSTAETVICTQNSALFLQKTTRKVAARDFGVSQSAIARILKRKKQICTLFNSNADAKSKSTMPPKFPKVEKLLIEWFHRCYDKHAAKTGEAKTGQLIAQARRTFEQRDFWFLLSAICSVVAVFCFCSFFCDFWSF